MILHLQSYLDIALLALRMIIATIFLVHGLPKWKMWKAKPSAQMSSAMLGIFRLLSLAEPLGALGLATGTLTQLASLGLALVMLGAIYNKAFKWKRTFSGEGGWEFDLSILGGLVVLIVIGAGTIAIDALMRW